MKTTLSLLTLLWLPFNIAMAQTGSNIAYQDATVRFTVITEGVVRMEYNANGQFVDDASFIATQRTYPKSDYRVHKSGKRLVIETSALTLTYQLQSGPFNADNLSIRSAKKQPVVFAWHPGTKDTGNLKGTYRTLDGYNGNIGRDGKPMPIEDGLLSRSGWTLIDDSRGYLFDNSEWPWVKKRATDDDSKAEEPTDSNTTGQDWYFLAYGHNYKQALRDYTVFAGQMPLPPRYAFGYWWSRYWHYSDNDFRQHIAKFRNYGLPLDVLVVDIDWHYLGENKGGWTGYTWNRRLFPNPDGFLKWLKQENLQVTLNLHPADGIKHWEEHYPQMAAWMGVNAADSTDIPWQASDKHFMTGWLNTQLKPLEKAGVDFWWLDWQQWSNDKRYPRLSNTWWLNYVVFSDMQRTRPTRPMLYHRWGGLGNHRYQIGFSGDAIISWQSLNYQPYFNTTAANVLYGYWSHDIGGHYGPDHIDPELYVRWMQFGLYSPILRTHSTKEAGLNKEPWAFNEYYFSLLRNIINRRYQLTPYIYTMARKAHDEGISLCRPMYYDYPEAEQAYNNANQYMFGDQYLICPITAPMNDDVSTLNVWLPEGNDWFELSSGTLLKGGQTIERRFHLDEFPVYVKAGSIIPMYSKVQSLKQQDTPLTIAIAPGEKGVFTLYEDNGNDQAYEREYATTALAASRQGNILKVSIGARQGTYADMPNERKLTVKVLATAPPQQVLVDGATKAWRYEGNELALYIDLPLAPLSQPRSVEVQYADDAPDVTDGLAGQFRRVQQNVLHLKKQDANIVLTERLGTMESTGRAITYNPEQFNERVRQFRDNYDDLDSVLSEQQQADKRKQRISDEMKQHFLHMTQ
ncbi:MAG: DUF5110 domain-containing protein [Bacteroidaceae bacterium]|nr:DUF5110 domain-containing protein [Bacteroidaceae bacterium]